MCVSFFDSFSIAQKEGQWGKWWTLPQLSQLYSELDRLQSRIFHLRNFFGHGISSDGIQDRKNLVAIVALSKQRNEDGFGHDVVRNKNGN